MRHARPLLIAIPLLAACVQQPATPPVESVDTHLLLAEIALSRNEPGIAAGQYQLALEQSRDPELARRGMLVALQANDFPAAARAADRWEVLAPADNEMLQFQAVLHSRRGDRAAALGYLLRLLDADPADTTLAAITGMLAGEPDRWRAADLLAELAEARPQFGEAWFGAALLALEADRPLQAARFADAALERAPDDTDAQFLRARARLLSAPNPPAAAILAPLAHFADASDPSLRYRYAGLLVLAGEFERADGLFEDILLNQPDQHDVRLARAMLALDRGDAALASAELQALLERQGHVQDAWYFLALIAERHGNYNEAVDCYARVAPGGPRWLDAQAGVGRVLLGIDGPLALQQFFGKLSGLWPEQAAALAAREIGLLAESGHPEEALTRFDELESTVRKLPAELRWQGALAAAAAGETDRARALLLVLLEENPGNPMLESALGGVLLDAGRIGPAAELLDRALAAAPANPAILDTVGWLRFRQGRANDARPLLEESWWRTPSASSGAHLYRVLLTLEPAAAEAFGQTLRGRFPAALDEGI